MENNKHITTELKNQSKSFMTKKDKHKNCNNINETNKSNQDNKKNIGLSNFSYADYVILSATLSYAIAEELNDEDLDLFIIFLGQITSDLALLRTKRGYDLKRKLAQNQQDQEGIYDTLVAEQGAEDISIVGLRRKKKRYRKTKKEKKA